MARDESLAVPLIGLTEELIFRGYLMSVAEEWKGRKFAIVFTSVLFWLAHLGQGNVHEVLGMAGALTISVTFALARYTSGGLWLPIGLHAGYDWMAFSFGGDIGLGFPALTRYQPNVPSWLVGPSGHVGVLDLAFYLALLLAIAFCCRDIGREETLTEKRLATDGLEAAMRRECCQHDGMREKRCQSPKRHDHRSRWKSVACLAQWRQSNPAMPLASVE